MMNPLNGLLIFCLSLAGAVWFFLDVCSVLDDDKADLGSRKPPADVDPEF